MTRMDAFLLDGAIGLAIVSAVAKAVGFDGFDETIDEVGEMLGCCCSCDWF